MMGISMVEHLKPETVKSQSPYQTTPRLHRLATTGSKAQTMCGITKFHKFMFLVLLP